MGKLAYVIVIGLAQLGKSVKIICMDAWNPQQYKKFENERARPFWDLAKKVNFEKVFSMLDVGCGTGELTRTLHMAHQLPRTLGIDSSAKMLETAKTIVERGLTFEQAAIETFQPKEQFDLVFSNAALQWVEGHDALFLKLLTWLKPGGQLAVQMPINQDHPSHRIAEDLASQFGVKPRTSPLLTPEAYARLLWNAGMHNTNVTMKVYLHPMPSGKEVVEWTKGTLLNYYKQRLSEIRFSEFLREYQREVLHDTGAGSYLYTFKRLFIVASRD